MDTLLITGGAGFVGANLALLFKAHFPRARVMAFDNLSRRGSELNLERLTQAGVEFIHGDVRQLSDLRQCPPCDWLIECSAEPSVHAGYQSGVQYCMDTNLIGAINCLHFLNACKGKMIFLSSSRVYAIEALRQLPLKVQGHRFALDLSSSDPKGLSAKGISEHFSIEGPRSLYGATKLCAELLIQEFAHMFELTALVNRCGVLTGPWQMGKVDQGFMALWVASAYYCRGLNYMGFNGTGHQVRDILHVHDLFELLLWQITHLGQETFQVFNVGGGEDNSVSLRELTQMVEDISGRSMVVGTKPDTLPADIPFYVSDCSKIQALSGWAPHWTKAAIIEDLWHWIETHHQTLRRIFCT